ncbi:rho-N domain-containing protein 1, chloroplastic-like isoform X1 [Primulina eburnea]|uniref:rho-N domain-containing protein 1, chloroplastic-like isoform X1 n=1 Tax=Primulina eburnea TaxID=1245227 RepID=UPI003C6C58F2
MSHHSVSFVWKIIPEIFLNLDAGYVPHDVRCQTYSGVSGKTVGILFNSSRGDHKLNSDVRCLSLRHASRHTSSVCHASTGNYQRNSDSFNRKRSGFSRNRNRHNEERDGHEDLEASETVPSKNGRPLLSVSGNQKFQGTATPGPREKEIVELFRKVQAQLRERAAMKEEKKVEELQGKNKQNETVDSLLKLLRKHSVQQGKKSTNGSRSKEFILGEPEHVSLTEERSTNISDYDNSVKHKTQESPDPLHNRPKSNFQKRSPVPEIKFQPKDSDDLVTPISQGNLDGNTKGLTLEVEAENSLELNIESDFDSESYVEPLFSEGNVLDEMTEDEASHIYGGEFLDAAEASDLSAMKLTELKALAKSRGMKGFSKLKKFELIELLSESLI